MNPRNGASLTNIIDVTAHSIRLFQENGQPKHINAICIPKTDISIAEPIEVHIDELGNNTDQMYQLIGIINDGTVGGLESLSNYMNENLFRKDDPAINEHHYRITKQQYNDETHNIYNIYKTNTYHINNNMYTDEHYYNNAQTIHNNITNNISNTSSISNNEHALDLK